MALMFTATANIKKAVALLNGLHDTKFPRLLSRIVQKLHLKDERTFSEKEEEILEDVLELSSSDLELVLEACEFFLHQAAYHSAKPTVLGQQLQQLGLDDSKVSVLTEAWAGSAREVVERLRRRTLAPKQLETVNWRLNLQMAQSSQAKLKQPNAMLELGIRDEDGGGNQQVRMEFTHDELYRFYEQLETVQKQLDSLS